jgi:simple sugar transport system permease protein
MDWKRFSFIGLIIAVLFGVVVMVGQVKQPPLLIVTSMLATTIAVATPLTLGALSGVFCERAGVVNIGIEGMMLTAAFFGWLSGIYMFNLYGFAPGLSITLGVFFAILTGGLMALLHAVLSITFKVDQIIGGTVINILAVGLTGFLNRQLFFGKGSVFGGSVPGSPGVLPTIHVPITELFTSVCGSSATCLESVQAINRVFDQKPVAISAILLVFISHYVLFNTRWGLRTRAVGEHPKAADTLGINVNRTRYISVLLGGMMAGFAGAYFVLGSVGRFDEVMTAGRGFVGLAAMIFGNYNPVGSLGAGMLFGFADSLASKLAILKVPIPNKFLEMGPYVITMIVLAGVVGRGQPPAAGGKPYEKE